MFWRRMRWLLLVVASAAASSVVFTTPAAADPPRATATFDVTGCGVVVVTAQNPTDTDVDYVIDVLSPDQSQGGVRFFAFLTVPAKETKVSAAPVADQDRVRFSGRPAAVVASERTYQAPATCTTGRIELLVQSSCVNFLATLTSQKAQEPTDVQVLADGNVVIPADRLAPGATLAGLVKPPDSGPLTVTVQRRVVDGGPFVDMYSVEGIQLRQCDATTKIDIADTCAGIHVTTHVPVGDPRGALIVEAAPGDPGRREFDLTTNPDEFDIPVEPGTLLALGYDPEDGFEASAFHRHLPNCPPTPAPSAPTAPSGDGGGLPVTGAPTTTAAAVGAGLLVLGATIVLLLRRRKATFTP